MAEQLTFDFKPPSPQLPQLWTPDDIFNALDQSILATFREDSRLERKSYRVSQRTLSEYLSMWANTQPHGGIILLGVEKDGTLTGCRAATTEQLNHLETARGLCPDAKHVFKRVPIKNVRGEDDFIVAVRVYYNESKLVETTSGDAYTREGDVCRSLSEAEKREVRLNKGELQCESEPVSLVYPEDFDIDLVQTFVDEFTRKRGLTQRQSREDILVLNKMGKKVDGQFLPNVAGALLFAKDPRAAIPGAYIRIIRYDGTSEQFGNKLNSVFDRVIEGPLPRQLLEAEQVIGTQVRSFTRLGKDGRFATRPEYPKDVWLEAIVNAVVHRSYNMRNMAIFVKMFEDRFVVESPGVFMPPTTAATVYEAHNPRNPNLMWVLYYFDFVKLAYEGTRRMRDGMREAHLPEPLFVQRDANVFQVQVTLKNDVEHRRAFVHSDVADLVDEAKYAILSDDEKVIISSLADKRALSVTEAMIVIGKDWKSTKDVLDHLTELKIVGRKPGKPRDPHRKYTLLGKPSARRERAR